jgi:hypothetical protein
MKHLLSEVCHPEMALQAYIKLGGDESQARARRPSPAAYAVGAVSRQLSRTESPFCYLGYMYLLEGSTAIIAPRIRTVLEHLNSPLDFIDEHATEDEKHTDLLATAIQDIVSTFPAAKEDILFAFDCFASVYPTPVWTGAYKRACEEVSPPN